MSRFSDADQVYATVGQTLAAMVKSRGVGSALSGLDTILLLELSDPKAPLTLHLSADGESAVDFGSTAAASMRIAMSAELAHELLLGQLNPYAAVSAGEIQVSGPIGPLMGVLPKILFATPPVYRAVLADAGVLAEPAADSGAPE